MVHLSGAGDAFPYSAQHSTYFYRTINDKILKKSKAFLGYRPSDVTIQPGDILGMNRSGAAVITYDEARHDSDYSSHADIVVNVQGATIHAIGGNVSPSPGSVGKKTFSLVGGELVNASKTQTVFVVIRSFLS